MRLLLDTNILTRLCHPAREENRAGEALDGDVILAAQALEVDGVVITENLRHMTRFVTAYRWQEAPVGI